MKILAHRGASKDAPENTLEAFALAVEQGADGVELDVMRCGSGELVVCHDEVLSRLAGVPWQVNQTPYSQLKTADVGTRLGFKPARIPLLEEVFELLPAHLLVNVELKCDDVLDRGLTVETARLVTKRGWAERVLFSSFNPLCLLRLARCGKSLKRGQLIDPDKAWWPQAHLWLPITAKDSVHPESSACTPQRVARWHQRGLQVAVWTVDDPARAAELQSMGVDVLITNRPALFRSRGPA